MKILYITEIYPGPKRKVGVWGGGEQLRKRMWKKGQKFVEKYDWDVIAASALEVYREVTEERT